MLRLVKGSAVYRGQFDYYKVTIITICLYCIVLINDKLSIFLKISFCFPSCCCMTRGIFSLIQ